MEKHQLSTMIAGLSLLVAIISVIVPSVYAGDDEYNKKDLCEDNGGNWKDGRCDFKTDDEDKADKYTDDVIKVREFEEEKAAEEDALCDDEDAETTNIPLCKSNDVILGEAFAKEKKSAEETEKEICEKYGGEDSEHVEWDDGECKFDNTDKGRDLESHHGDECESSDFRAENEEFCS